MALDTSRLGDRVNVRQRAQQYAYLVDSIRALEARVSALEEAKAPKRGRPPKAVKEDPTAEKLAESQPAEKPEASATEEEGSDGETEQAG